MWKTQPEESENLQLLLDELDIQLEGVDQESLFEFDDTIPDLSLPPTIHAKDRQLEKSVTLLNGLSLIVGVTIGSGIFASPGPVMGYTNSVGAALSIWILAGLLSMTGGLCYVELGTMIPLSGGEHPYLNKAYGPMPAFLFSWTGILASRPGSVAIVTTICSQYFCGILFNASSTWLVKIFAIIFTTLLTAVNCFSTKISGDFMNIMTLLKIFALVWIAILAIFYTRHNSSGNFNGSLFSGSSENPGNYALALFSALWAYDGWNNLGYIAGEMKNPGVDLPKAIIGGTAIVIISYFTTNLAYYSVLSKSVIATATTIGLVKCC